MNCATSCISVAVGGHDCFTNRHLVNILFTRSFENITGSVVCTAKNLTKIWKFFVWQKMYIYTHNSSFNPLPDEKLVRIQSICRREIHCGSLSEILLSFFFFQLENIVGKKKMLVTSIFSFSHNVFKTCLSCSMLES